MEKEATAIIDAVRKWNHFLAGRRFTLITDQKSVAFMLDNRKRTKVKNNKIQCWRLELAPFSYEIKYRPDRENNAPDALTRAFCSAVSSCNLEELHWDLCHLGVTRLLLSPCVRKTYRFRPMTSSEYVLHAVYMRKLNRDIIAMMKGL